MNEKPQSIPEITNQNDTMEETLLKVNVEIY